MIPSARQIVITGPESTGKSTLSEGLAVRYDTLWVPEYAREFLSGLDRRYREEDLLRMAREQWRRQRLARYATDRLFFCDTGFLVFKVWSEVAYGTCHPWIVRMLRRHRPALYLLCDIDLPWVEDPMREHPDRREELMAIYRRELQALGLPFAVVRGPSPETRLARAVEAIARLTGEKP